MLGTRKSDVHGFTADRLNGKDFFFVPRGGRGCVTHLTKSGASFGVPSVDRRKFIVAIGRLGRTLHVLLARGVNPSAGGSICSLVLRRRKQLVTVLPISNSRPHALFSLPLSGLPANIFALALVSRSCRTCYRELMFARFPRALGLGLSSAVSMRRKRQGVSIGVHDASGGKVPRPNSFSLTITRAFLRRPAVHSGFDACLFLDDGLGKRARRPLDC